MSQRILMMTAAIAFALAVAAAIGAVALSEASADAPSSAAALQVSAPELTQLSTITASISTRAPRGSAATPTVARAG
jgi:hypothetical protein